MVLDTSVDLEQDHSMVDIKLEQAEVELLGFGDGFLRVPFSYSPYSTSKVCLESCKQVYNCVGYRVCHNLREEKHTKS